MNNAQDLGAQEPDTNVVQLDGENNAPAVDPPAVEAFMNELLGTGTETSTDPENLLDDELVETYISIQEPEPFIETPVDSLFDVSHFQNFPHPGVPNSSLVHFTLAADVIYVLPEDQRFNFTAGEKLARNEYTPVPFGVAALGLDMMDHKQLSFTSRSGKRDTHLTLYGRTKAGKLAPVCRIFLGQIENVNDRTQSKTMFTNGYGLILAETGTQGRPRSEHLNRAMEDKIDEIFYALYTNEVRPTRLRIRQGDSMVTVEPQDGQFKELLDKYLRSTAQGTGRRGRVTTSRPAPTVATTPGTVDLDND